MAIRGLTASYTARRSRPWRWERSALRNRAHREDLGRAGLVLRDLKHQHTTRCDEEAGRHPRWHRWTKPLDLNCPATPACPANLPRIPFTMSPLNHFLTWFQGLSMEQRRDSAALATQFVPGFHSLRPFENIEQLVSDFEQRVSEAAESRMSTAGMALALRSFMEVFVLPKRGTAAQWDSIGSDLQKLADEHGGAFGDMAMRVPLRKQQWLRSVAAWDKMVIELNNAKLQELVLM